MSSLTVMRALRASAGSRSGIALVCTTQKYSFATFASSTASPVSRASTALTLHRRLCSTNVEGLEVSKPTMEDAKNMPRFYSEFSNEALAIMATQGEQGARQERLIREIMIVDNVSWDDAQPTFQAMSEANKAGMALAKVPYKIGIATALTAAFSSIPLCFHMDTVMWFNERFVTADIPESKDLETWLEVGSWAWNWMEPPLGQISFFLLCLQFARSQMQNLGAKPFTGWLLHRRADRLCAAYPTYNKKIVTEFSTTDDWH
eukprot:JP436391.1.p1 GENE.JP436391.1~~JP436391.1.p1  ORF type:complete len:261 (+),score=61.19 JP436391.1:2-784(+)